MLETCRYNSLLRRVYKLTAACKRVTLAHFTVHRHLDKSQPSMNIFNANICNDPHYLACYRYGTLKRPSIRFPRMAYGQCDLHIHGTTRPVLYMQPHLPGPATLAIQHIVTHSYPNITLLNSFTAALSTHTHYLSLILGNAIGCTVHQHCRFGNHISHCANNSCCNV